MYIKANNKNGYIYEYLMLNPYFQNANVSNRTEKKEQPIFIYMYVYRCQKKTNGKQLLDFQKRLSGSKK